jgi:ABC-type cobalamin/Fe3+-siderophores transport system ATPase subunit
MIHRIVIKGYRRFSNLDLSPNPGMNIIVGDNESGKSTLLEAVALALTGKVNGRWAREELNPFWFNSAQVADFFSKYGTSEQVPLPEILTELYLADRDEFQRLRGVHNSQQADCPGVLMRIAPADQYTEEFDAYLRGSPPAILPVEFYDVEWKDFGDNIVNQRPKELATSFIDSRTIRSTSGVDYHTREMLSEHLDSKERASIAIAHRTSRQQITDTTLADINKRLAKEHSSLHDRPMGLQMDQSSRASWETGIVPQVDDIPFAMAGQGQQATIKVALAMSRTSGTSTFILIEEPENHLSHTSLTRLISRIEALAGDDQQLFVTTHSSFVLNRLGVDKLLLLDGDRTTNLVGLGEDTARYFRKLAGYDTLRLVLARKLALVEGPSDAIALERAYRDKVGRMPSEDGIDVLSMGGLTFRRALELCACLNRQAVALQDNDGYSPDEVRSTVDHLLAPDKRAMLVSDQAKGKTLEPQICSANDEATLRRLLGLAERADPVTWMTNNKTEWALRLFDADESITFPDYINEAVDLLR